MGRSLAQEHSRHRWTFPHAGRWAPRDGAESGQLLACSMPGSNLEGVDQLRAAMDGGPRLEGTPVVCCYYYWCHPVHFRAFLHYFLYKGHSCGLGACLWVFASSALLTIPQHGSQFWGGVAGSSREGVQAPGGIGEAPAQISGSASPQALREGLAGPAPSGSAGKGHRLINGY